MKLITITQPAFFEGEAEAITSLFDAGLEILHLRKPGASYEDMEQLLNRLPPEYLKRIVTHEHFQLASFRNLKGIHLNGRNPTAPAGFPGHISRSCHSLEEVAKYKATCDYVFLGTALSEDGGRHRKPVCTICPWESVSDRKGRLAGQGTGIR